MKDDFTGSFFVFTDKHEKYAIQCKILFDQCSTLPGDLALSHKLSQAEPFFLPSVSAPPTPHPKPTHWSHSNE